MDPRTRPLSPHLFIYRPQVTMVMSIVHRITGVGLYSGFVLLTWWLVAAAWNAEALEQVNAVLGHWLGRIVLFAFTWTFFHHMLGGIRYLVWDTGAGYSHQSRFGMAWLNAVGGLVLALILWALVLFF